MTVHSFKVDVILEDDDQTDAEVIQELIESTLAHKFTEDNREYGIENWPADLRVRHVYSGTEKRDQTPNGGSDGERSKAEGS